MTAPQLSYINTLRSERGIAPLTEDALKAFTSAAASRHIKALLATPRAPQTTAIERPEAPAALTPGVYETADGVFVVKPNRAKTRIYAKRLIEINGERATESGERVQIEFEYAPGTIYNLTEADRMPLDKAKALTIRYGRCINCGRPLKAAESVERGIGPVCRKSFS